MIIVGKVIQEAGKYVLPYRIPRKKEAQALQLKTLSKLIRRSSHTVFGMYYSFHKLIGQKKKDISVKDFQNAVPILTYNDFYDPWIKKMLAGDKNVTWPGQIKFFALSSGTTGSPSKRIPITRSMIRSFQRSSLLQFNVLFKLDFPISFYRTQVLTIGGSTELQFVDNHYEGDLSGILRKHTAIVARNLTQPGPHITKSKVFLEKVEMIVQEAPKWDIGSIAGIPTWVTIVLEKIIEKHQLNSIHDIWPNLKVYVHGGVYLDPYRERLNKLFTKKVIYLDTYLASEGYFGYQDNPNEAGMKILPNRGIFYEFIPFNKNYFDADGDIIDKHTALTIEEIEENVDYALVISTNSGLWRYLLGDLVRFIDKENLKLVISGRVKQTLNLCGEHLTLDNLNQAVKEVCTEVDIPIFDYTILPNEEEQTHHWYMEVEVQENTSSIMEKIDVKLFELNDDYQYVRKNALNLPKVHLVKPGTFYNFLKSKNKLGAQHKMPRVLNKQQRLEWLSFLKGNVNGI